jgi:hypothetical protein
VPWCNESIQTNTFTSKVRLVREYYEKQEENNNFLRSAADFTDRKWFFQGNLEKTFTRCSWQGDMTCQQKICRQTVDRVVYFAGAVLCVLIPW